MKKRQRATIKTALAKERLRQSYRPDRVRVLFVGEAPPASGRFFYQADSGLYRAVRDTFIRAFPTVSHEGFLESFRDRGSTWSIYVEGRLTDWIAGAATKSAAMAKTVSAGYLTNIVRPR